MNFSRRVLFHRKTTVCLKYFGQDCRFAVKISSHLRDEISRQILENEIKNIHRKRKQLIRQLKENNETLTTRVGFIYDTVLYIKINKVMKKNKFKGEKVHNIKIEHLRKLRSNLTRPKVCIISNIIHNFSSYHLTPHEEFALSFSLDQHIPTRVNENKIKTEFESFFFQVQKYTSNLDQQIQDELKTKIRRTCENYSKVKVLYKFQHVIDKLSKNKSIIIMRQDKGRGVTILDRKDYIEKCLNILDTKQFPKLRKDPTNTLERKMQHVLRLPSTRKRIQEIVPNRIKTGVIL